MSVIYNFFYITIARIRFLFYFIYFFVLLLFLYCILWHRFPWSDKAHKVGGSDSWALWTFPKLKIGQFSSITTTETVGDEGERNKTAAVTLDS